MRPALLELQRIIDPQTVDCVDLLTGAKLRVVDRALAGSARRYAVSLTWVYSLPHYDRLSGMAITWPELPHLTPEEALREIIVHLGGPAQVGLQSPWITEHFTRVYAAVKAVQEVRWNMSMDSVDARVFKTEYKASKTHRLLPVFRKEGNLYPESPSPEEASRGVTHVFVWGSLDARKNKGNMPPDPQLRLFDEDNATGKNLIRGRVLVGRDAVSLEVFSEQHSAVLRKALETLMGRDASLLSEHVENLKSSALKPASTAYDASLVPKRLLENVAPISMEAALVDTGRDGAAAGMASYYKDLYATFKEQSLPALKGSTPLAAAANPLLRPALVRLMKSHICSCDGVRRTKGIDLNLNPLLEQLGLQELISEPPPLGTVECEEEDADSDSDFDVESGGFFQSLIAKKGRQEPLVSRAPFSEAEFESMVKAAHKRCPDYEDAVDAVDFAFPDLLEFARDINQKVLNESECLFLEVLIVRACQILWPESKAPHFLDFEAIAHRMTAEIKAFAKAMFKAREKSPNILAGWVSNSAQPLLLEDLAEEFLACRKKVPTDSRPRGESVAVVLSFLKALIEELPR